MGGSGETGAADGSAADPPLRTAVIHLDTSFLIRALVRDSQEDTQLRDWMSADEPLGMSVIAWAEFLCGPINEIAVSLASLVVGHRAEFTEDMATIAARLFNGSGRRRGTMIDCMIAAAALAEDASIATGNPGDFRRFEPFGLTLVQM